METHDIYLEMSDMWSISYSAKSMQYSHLHIHATAVTHRHWQWPVKFTLEEAVASVVGYTWSFTYPHRYKSQGLRARDLGSQGMGPPYPIQTKPFALEMPFPLIVTWVPLVTDTLQSVFLTKTWWVSFLFSSSFTFLCSENTLIS